MDYQLSLIKSVPIEHVAEAIGMDVRRHTAMCPFHDDHHPSLHFHAKSNTFRCFACGARGNNIDLVMQLRGYSFRDAYHWIAEQNGIYLNPIPAAQSASVFRAKSDYSTQKRFRDQAMSAVNAPAVLDQTLVCRFASSQSPFCRALTANGILNDEQMTRAAKLYRLGRTHEDGVVFWLIDEQSRLREGKVMWYGADCHRLHSRKPVSASWLLKRKGLLDTGWTADRCLFGQHLLATATAHDSVVIAVVESEKTAVICSALLPSLSHHGTTTPCLWLATGGLSCLNTDLMRPLAGYRVVLFPDTDPDGAAFRHWSAAAEEASRLLGCRFAVSPILEQRATEEQKQRKIDIADFII